MFAGVPEHDSWSSTPSSWGPVELVAVIAGPVFVFCLLLIIGVVLFQHHQRNYNHRQRLDVEDPSCDHLYLAKDKTLQDLIFDLSTSGSGSGRSFFVSSFIFHMCVFFSRTCLIFAVLLQILQVYLCLCRGQWQGPSCCRRL